VRVNVLITLTPETAVPVLDLQDRLSLFRDLRSPRAWTDHCRASPARWNATDAEVVIDALREAERSPTVRPVNPVKLARRPRAVKARVGSVTVPERDEPPDEPALTPWEPTAHTEIQWLLLKLGNDMGLDVWVARNDRGCEVQGHRFADLPRLQAELPLQFDEATNRTIELIDVHWLRGNAIVAAFEIEHTTLIYSDLLRMADLIAMQPNLNIPLYLVAPDDRREKVLSEVNRPTFSRLSPPLSEVCRFISFSALRERLTQVAPFLRYLRPDFLDDVSESCEVEDA
jgi:hypothetical protein